MEGEKGKEGMEVNGPDKALESVFTDSKVPPLTLQPSLPAGTSWTGQSNGMNSLERQVPRNCHFVTYLPKDTEGRCSYPHFTDEETKANLTD